MNLKKYLRERAEKDAESLITEEDRLFCQRLAQKAQEGKRQEEAEKQKSAEKRKRKNNS